jgi:hypothetical protein
VSRLASVVKRLVELYLIIVGGGYTLASAVALAMNGHSLLTTADRIELRDLRSDLGENSIMFAFAAATLIGGVGIYKYRPWGLLLAVVLGILAIAESVAASAIDPWEYHNFTIGLPMAAIMIWAMLPPTWVMFKRQRMKIS